MGPRHEPGRGSRHRPRLTILVKLLLAFAVPTIVMFSVFGYVAHDVARRDLEAELGKRLEAVASSAATQIRGKYLVDLVEGDENDRGHLNVRRKLLNLAAASSVVRIYVFDRQFQAKCGTDEDTPINTILHEVEQDRSELAQVFERGEPVSSVLFTGRDGKQYKAGYAPVRMSELDPGTDIVLAVGVDASPAYFDRLANLRRSLFFYGAVLALMVIAISVVVATLITRPVRKLAAAAERIGKGELGEPVVRSSRDEIGFLAETMDEMRADLAARDERMQLMLSGIAHEVRNPLGGMTLFAGILRDELEGDEEKSSHVARINKELRYLKEVVNDFLEYARRPAPELTDVDLGDLLADIIELAEADGELRGVRIHSELDSVVCPADPGQLRRVTLNLIRNAVQASAAAGESEVTVRVRADTGDAVMEFHNRGSVIAADLRERIFEPFYTTREKGTGLGLAFAREIVGDHGGTIEVTSDAETGTCFTIRLPRESAG